MLTNHLGFIHVIKVYMCRDFDHNTYTQSSYHIYVISYHKIYIQRYRETCIHTKSKTKDDEVKVDST